MELGAWWELIKQEFSVFGIKDDTPIRHLLLERIIDTQSSPTEEQKQIISKVADIVWKIIFTKAAKGQTFGNPDKIKSRFGESVEENYGLNSGPFIDLARAYWTYKIEIDELFPKHDEIGLAVILAKIEMDIGSVFFPTPGPYRIPVEMRKAEQLKLLSKYAPEIDLQLFLRQNPMLRLILTRNENPEEIQKYSHIRPAPLSVPHCFTRFPVPGSRMTCSLEPFHSGPHVAHGWFKKVYAVWED
jgi:hypothetical protein